MQKRMKIKIANTLIISVIIMLLFIRFAYNTVDTVAIENKNESHHSHHHGFVQYTSDIDINCNT
jgi:uncharacterized membrane protein